MDSHRVWEKLKEEFFAVLPPTLFFFVALHVVALIRVLMARAAGINATSSVSIAVAALILGKSVLVADMLPVVNRYPEKPLIYPVVWKTGLYLIVASLIHYGERLFDFAREAGGAAAGFDKMAAEIVWPHFWAVQIVLFLLILMYCTTRELVRVIGRDRVMRLFFGPTPLPEF
jgi:hypothetical protein